MSRIVRAKGAPDSCPCCTSALRSVWGPHKTCLTCFTAGQHRCGEPTKAGTPCKHWTKTESCPQHTASDSELTLVVDNPTEEIEAAAAP